MALLAVLAFSAGPGTTSSAGAALPIHVVKTVTLGTASPDFLDTGIKLKASDSAAISATGDGTCHFPSADDCPVGPAGAGYTCANGPHGSQPPGPAGADVPYGAVAGRLGSGNGFYIGAGKTVNGPGELFLVYNDCNPPAGYSDNGGSFQVSIDATIQPVKISGTIRDTDNNPVSGVTIRADQNGTRVAIGTSAADGTYTLSVPPGQTHLSADDPAVCVAPAGPSCARTTDLDAQDDTTIDWVSTGCVKMVTFESLAAVNGCFTKTGDSTWETDKQFRMNGIDVVPNGKVTFDRQSGLVSFPAANWTFGGATYTFSAPFSLNFNQPQQLVTPSGRLGAAAGIKLPLDLVTITFIPGSATLATALTWSRDLRSPTTGPQPAGACQGTVKVALTLATTNADGLKSASLELKPGETMCVSNDPGKPDNPTHPSGIPNVSSLKGTYDFATGYWTLGGKVGGLPLFGGKVSLTGSLTLGGDPVGYRGISVLVEGLNKPVYGPLLLQRGGFGGSVANEKAPLNLTITAGFSLGPHLNAPVIEPVPLIGNITLVPSEEVSIDPTLTYSDADGNPLTLNDAMLSGSGIVKVWDYPLLRGSIAYLPGPSAITLDGRIDFGDEAGQFIHIGGHGSGFIDFSRHGLLFLDGREDIELRYLGLPSASAEVIVNSESRVIAACIDNGSDPRYGIVIHYNAFRSPDIGGCDLTSFRAIPPVVPSAHPATAAVAAARAGTFSVASGTKLLVVRVSGRAAAAPRLLVTGPRFRLAANAHGGASRGRSRIYAMPDGFTYVVLVRPRAGRWTLAPEGGSSIKALSFAGAAPAPRVRATLHRSGCAQSLRWAIRPQPGQVVRFIDRGTADGSGRVLRLVAGRSGRLRVIGVGDGRRVVQAQVFQGGGLRRTIRVGSYVAATTRIGAPTGLRTRRAGRRVTLTWIQSCGAARYAVAVGTGSPTVVVRPKVVLASPAKRTIVKVTSIAADGARGGSATFALHATKR